MTSAGRAIPTFPCTRHLAGSWGTADDLWSTTAETAAVLRRVVTVQEKLDGVNLGFWREGRDLKAVSKSAPLEVIPFSQIRHLESLADPIAELLAKLGSPYALFGEYMPMGVGASWYLIDIYDRRSRKFLAQQEIKRAIATLRARIPVVPTLFHGRIGSISRLQRLIDEATGRASPMEGVYVREDVGAYLKHRYKFVRHGFVKHEFSALCEFW